MNKAPQATVVIATRNRWEDLRGALESCRRLSTPVDVLVIDDGSTDGTAEHVRTGFPEVQLVRHEESQGYIACRNEGARLARTPFIFSIDDDAAFATPNVVEQTLGEFAPPRVGAVAIPFANINCGPQVHQLAPSAEGCYVTDRYIGTAHALRREIFLKLGGYRADYVHQGEEGDYCLRMLAAGYVVRLGRGQLIHHFESPRRNMDRLEYWGCRNLLRTTWRNTPWPDLAWQAPGNVFNLLKHSFKVRRFRHRLRGTGAGLLDGVRRRGERRPVSRSAFRLFRRLGRRGPVLFSEIADQLPALKEEVGVGLPMPVESALAVAAGDQ